MKLVVFLIVAAMIVTVVIGKFYLDNYWDKTFSQSDSVTVTKVKIKNRYGIELVAD